MSSTNKTTNYNLSQFIGSDKPAWLVDYNGDMAAIDAQMKVNADAAAAAQSKANTADGKADTNASAISTLDSQVNGVSGIAADVVTLQGNVNTINSLIGNGEPTTTDKTLIGAINELHSDITTPEGVYAPVPTYEEVFATGDGTKTITQLMNEVFTAFKAIVDALPDDEGVFAASAYIENIASGCVHKFPFPISLRTKASSTTGEVYLQLAVGNTGDILIGQYIFSAASTFYRSSIAQADGSVTFTDGSSVVVGNGNKVAIDYYVCKKI